MVAFNKKMRNNNKVFISDASFYVFGDLFNNNSKLKPGKNGIYIQHPRKDMPIKTLKQFTQKQKQKQNLKSKRKLKKGKSRKRSKK